MFKKKGVVPQHGWNKWEPILEYEEEEILDYENIEVRTDHSSSFTHPTITKKGNPIIRKIQQQRRQCKVCGITQQMDIGANVDEEECIEELVHK